MSLVGPESLSVGEDVGTVSVVLKSENPYETAFSMLVVCGELDPPQATGARHCRKHTLHSI